MTFEERVHKFSRAGFSEPQARFLVTVALHGGFCLRRQYMTLAGLQYGAGVRDFMDRLVRRKLAARMSFRRDRGHVYQLSASMISDATGDPEQRHRRAVSAALIARKLMVLDYVLAHQDVNWLATEHDKIAFFTSRFGLRTSDFPQRVFVAATDLPATIRYFNHKLPIAVAPDGVVSVVWLAVDAAAAGFESFVLDHMAVLRALPHWRLVVVAPRPNMALRTCRQAVDRILMQQARRQPRRGNGRDDAAFGELNSAFMAALRQGRGALVTEELPFVYDRFGTRPGVS